MEMLLDGDVLAGRWQDNLGCGDARKADDARAGD